MKAAVFHDPLQLEVRRVVDPEPGPGEVLVRVEACGICGSDLHLYRTNAHRDAGVLITNAEGLEIPGHEYSGVIVAVGPDVAAYKAGDRVVGVTGGGAFAELVAVPVNPYQIAAMPDAVSFEEAATTEPLADSLQIVRKGELRGGETVVVYGAGIIGLGVIQALGVSPARPRTIIAVDASDERLALARELGAQATINARTVDDVVLAVGDIIGWTKTMWGKPTPQVDVVFDCAGYLKHMAGRPPLQNALDMLAPQDGRIVCFGAYESEFPVRFDDVINKQVRIIGSMGYSPEELVQALQLMATGAVDRKRLITHRFPLDQITEAFETQGAGKAIKVMVLPRSEA